MLLCIYKWQIPCELKEIKYRDNFSSVFAFSKVGTIVSYVPKNKKKKNVILISSMHDDGGIDECTGDKKKPEIISYYNQHKIGVDMVDKMCSAYDVQRGTRRWSMVVFFSMLNIAGINSQIIYIGNKNEQICRRFFLKQLGKDLIHEHLQRRAQIPSLHLALRLRIKELLPQEQETESTQGSVELLGRQRCKPCLKIKTRRLTKYSCRSCGQYLCLQHCQFQCADCAQRDDIPHIE